MTHSNAGRGLMSAARSPTTSKFGRIFDASPLGLSWPDPEALGKAGGPMDQPGHGDPLESGNVYASIAEGDLDNPSIPAVFTYFGQFVDHNITFDTTSISEAQIDPDSVRNFRTAALELDSLYGSGPSASPHLYDRDPKRYGMLLLGSIEDPGRGLCADALLMDLPRNQQGTALIGDPRNDENLITSQIHITFVRFHNSVLERVRSGELDSHRKLYEDPFDFACRLVTWHYQWIVLNEYLPHIVEKDVIADIMSNGRKLYDPSDKAKEAFIPVEFSAAAFRFGHSQVQPGYVIVRDGAPIAPLPDRFDAAVFGDGIVRDGTGGAKLPYGLRKDLRGGVPIRRTDLIHWNQFIKIGGGIRTGTRLSSKINRKIASPLLNMPMPPDFGSSSSLASRNLIRNQLYRLPSGYFAVQQARECGIDLEKVPADVLWAKPYDFKDCEAPLWYYFLAEAEHFSGGEKLGPLGGRIVAEVLIGLLQKDPQSYLFRSPDWQPILGGVNAAPSHFSLVDVLQIAKMNGTKDAPAY